MAKKMARLMLVAMICLAFGAQARISMTQESSEDGLETYSFRGKINGREQRIDLVKVPNPSAIDPAQIRPQYPIVLSKHSAGLLPNAPEYLNIHHGPGYPLQDVFARQVDAVLAVNSLFYHYSHSKYQPPASSYIVGDAACIGYTRMRDQYEKGDFGILDALLRIHRSIQIFEEVADPEAGTIVETLREEFYEILAHYYPDKVAYVYQTYDKYQNGKSYHPLKLMRLDPYDGMDQIAEQISALRAAKYTFPTSPTIIWDGQPVPFDQTGIVKTERGSLAPTPGTLGHMMENFNARTIMAFTRDDHILFITVKGNQNKKLDDDFGMDFFDLQNFLTEISEQFGIVHAVGLDGGGSSQMMRRDFATNSLSFVNEVPDHEKDRPISFSLMVMRSPTDQPGRTFGDAQEIMPPAPANDDRYHQANLEELASWLKAELRQARSRSGKSVTQLVLIRHAESEANNALMTGNDGKFHSVGGNSVLSELGRQQAAVIHRFLKILHEQEDVQTRFEVSPLERTKETMGQAIRRHALEIPSLRERDRRPDGGKYPEPVAEFKQRVAENLNRWQQSTDSDRIVVVGHSLFISEFISQSMGGNCSQAFLHLGNTAITVLQFQDGDTGPDHLGGRSSEIIAAGMVDHLPKNLRSGHHTAPYYMDESRFPFSLLDRMWDETHPGMIEALDHELVLVRGVESDSNGRRVEDIQAALARLDGKETQFVVPSREWAKNSLPASILEFAEVNEDLMLCFDNQQLSEQQARKIIKSLREERGRKRTVVVADPVFIQACIDELFNASGKAPLRLDEGSLTIVHFTSNSAKELQDAGEQQLQQFFEIQSLGMRPNAYLDR